jgi:hypothetical protein
MYDLDAYAMGYCDGYEGLDKCPCFESQGKILTEEHMTDKQVDDYYRGYNQGIKDWNESFQFKETA